MTTTVLAIDQGTTATKALLVSPNGEVLASSSVAVQRSYPHPGWVEQDAVEIWDSVVAAVGRLPKADIAAVAVSAQRESVLVWEAGTGRPLAPCISWQCNRAADRCSSMRAAGLEPLVRDLTGLPLAPMFSGPKLGHLLASQPELRKATWSGRALAGTVDSWLAWNLSGRSLHVTDAGNASRTMLFDIHRLAWSEQLASIFDVPVDALPRVVSSGGVIGETVAQGPLPRAPIASLTADSHAALYGLGCLVPGTAKATFGTGSSLASVVGREPKCSESGLATSVAWLREGPTFVLEGNVFCSGATVEWVSHLLGLPGVAAVETLARSINSTGGVHIVPGFAGLGAPYWEAAAKGQISGLRLGTGAAEIALAAIESVAFQVADLAQALEKDVGEPLREIHVDGGATVNGSLMQLQADLLGCRVVRSQVRDASALGAAFMAGLAVGLFASEDQTAVIGRRGDAIEPTMPADQREDRLNAWRKAVRNVIVSRPEKAAP